jgi:hypothetical protein
LEAPPLVAPPFEAPPLVVAPPLLVLGEPALPLVVPPLPVLGEPALPLVVPPLPVLGEPPLPVVVPPLPVLGEPALPVVVPPLPVLGEPPLSGPAEPPFALPMPPVLPEAAYVPHAAARELSDTSATERIIFIGGISGWQGRSTRATTNGLRLSGVGRTFRAGNKSSPNSNNRERRELCCQRSNA